MIKKVRNTIEKYNMLSKGEKVIAALSGGADSVALLSALCRIKEEYDLTIYALHVHHGIRGEEADEDCSFCMEFCSKMGVELFIKQYDVPEMAEELGIGEEEAGRIARYDAFEEMTFLLGADKVAVAHNMNDDAETVIMRLARGTGMKGLCGISPVRDNIIRPLINVSRAEIEEYLEKENIGYRTDSTNLEDEYTRNRIRHNVLPVLEKEVNSSAAANIAFASQMLAEEEDFIEGFALENFEKCLVSQSEDKIELDAGKFSEMHTAVKKRVVRIAFEKISGRMKDVGRSHIESILDIFEGETGRSIMLPYGITAEKSYDKAVLKKTAEGKDFFYEIEGETYIEECGIFVSLSDKKDFSADESRCFNTEKIQGKIFARSRKDGDRLCINKDGRSKKIKDILIDMKIPRDEREKTVIIGSEGGILWVYPYRHCSASAADKECVNKMYINIRRAYK